jgi:hypothetical protein
MCRSSRRSWPVLLPLITFVLTVAPGSLFAQTPTTPPASGSPVQQASAVAEPHDTADLYNSLRDVINYGAELFNKQADHAGCYRTYQGALISIRPFMAPETRKKIDESIVRAESLPFPADRAFELRKILDEIRTSAAPNRTSPAVAGTPAPNVAAPTVGLPKVVAPTVDAPNVDVPKVDPPKVGLPNLDLPRITDAPKVDVPKVEKPNIDLPKVVPAKVDLPRIEDKKTEIPRDPLKTELPKIDPPKVDLPKIDLPKVEDKKTDAPKDPLIIELPKVNPPKIDLPKIDLPRIEDKKTETPKAVDPLKTDLPSLDPPKVEAPKVNPPKVEVPKVDLPGDPLRIEPPTIDSLPNKKGDAKVEKPKTVPPAASVPAIDLLQFDQPARLNSQKCEVFGNVALDGKPLPAGFVVTLVSAEGKRYSATVQKEGNYRLASSIPAGKYRMAIELAAGIAGTQVVVPARYLNEATSGLNFEVAAGQATVDVQMKK